MPHKAGQGLAVAQAPVEVRKSVPVQEPILPHVPRVSMAEGSGEEKPKKQKLDAGFLMDLGSVLEWVRKTANKDEYHLGKHHEGELKREAVAVLAAVERVDAAAKKSSS